MQLTQCLLFFFCCCCVFSSLCIVLAVPQQAAAPSPHEPHRNTNNNINKSGDTSRNNVKCGGILYGRSGVIQTPGFPAAFDTPLSCTWIIDGSGHHRSSPNGGSADNNASIVVYLTQLYVLSGLRFTGYLVYDDTFDLRIKSEESFVVQEEDATQVMWLKFSTKYLEIQFTIDTLHGTHLRALDRFLDVYGFNITYEVASDTIKPYQCNALKCRFLGHCFAAADFRYEDVDDDDDDDNNRITGNKDHHRRCRSEGNSSEIGLAMLIMIGTIIIIIKSNLCHRITTEQAIPLPILCSLSLPTTHPIRCNKCPNRFYNSPGPPIYPIPFPSPVHSPTPPPPPWANIHWHRRPLTVSHV